MYSSDIRVFLTFLYKVLSPFCTLSKKSSKVSVVYFLPSILFNLLRTSISNMFVLAVFSTDNGNGVLPKSRSSMFILLARSSKISKS